MGAGRKKKILSLKGTNPPPLTPNCSCPARNLRKDDLAGVIFGCKNHTFSECFSNQLFGLPAPHYSYVKNIRPGLTLFLFNYSDRKLHGIFEAESSGQMNINPHGWVSDGEECTPYAAQVRVRIRMLCEPLPEAQFAPIISDNYYEQRLFWFELDQTQTKKLVSLFSSYPAPKSVFHTGKAVRLDNLHNPATRTTAVETEDHVPGFHSGPSQKSSSMDVGVLKRTTSSVVSSDMCHSLPAKRWSELFNDPHSDENKEWDGSSCISPALDRESQTSEPSAESDYSEEIWNVVQTNDKSSEENAENDAAHSLSMAALQVEERFASSSQMVAETKTTDLLYSFMQEFEGLKASHSKQILKISCLEEELAESKEEIKNLKNWCNLLERKSFSSGIVDVESKALMKHGSEIVDSILIMGGFDGSSWLSSVDSYSPSCDSTKSLSPMTLVRSYASAARLNDEFYIFGGAHNGILYDTVESYNPTINQWVTRPSLNQKKGNLAGASLRDRIFAIGGGNGVDCFSEVEMLDLNIGEWISTQSMQNERFAPAAAELNGALYVVGGYDGKNYLNCTERFDPRQHYWGRLGSMSMRRGCHSLVVLNEKLYALGGFDGHRMVSTVEIFDPRVGSWTMGEAMNDCRGYSGAVVIGEKIYIIGGLRGNNEILNRMECYQERNGWKPTNLKGFGRRCFFSALLLNDSCPHFN